MKKIITSILTTILLLICLVGCTESTTKSQFESKNENQEEYLSCIVVDDTINTTYCKAYFNITVGEFIEKYNKLVNISDNYESVKALMQLNTQPAFSSLDNFDTYDVTNPVVGINRSAVRISITTLKGSKIFIL